MVKRVKVGKLVIKRVIGKIVRVDMSYGDILKTASKELEEQR